MHILVVGGAGYIGSHVCKVLSESGFAPVVYDNLSTGHPWAIRFGPFFQGDLDDEEQLRQAFNQYTPQAVIHLASLINVRDSIVNPALYYEKNLFSTLKLLKIMVEKRVLNLVFSSTAAIYGSPQYVPIDEEHPKNPLNAYGKTKWAVEGMLQDFAVAHGLRYAALRYFNACGADFSGLIGEAHQPETHLIPLVIRTALGLQSTLQIYGDNHPTPDGTAVRDYVHVLDLADAHVKALSYLFGESQSIQVNLGTGEGFSVKQVVEMVSRFANQEVPFHILPKLANDSPVLVADSRRAKGILNWEPRFSDLQTIISTAWNWQAQTPAHKLKELQKFTESTSNR